ncbi:hypothetical protein QO004_002479 [Rhizobium mesoamericanum]|uniref:hypothetical protein n=1 Tax=Rhizobium mesoamericanum TaxID=1079800 RepID=UPI00278848C0|nr:hypothetical protein [Rhizobium mesoamericanum]MDQ0560690.1 hypothetical protein [Rhizobium mesoamericanum]
MTRIIGAAALLTIAMAAYAAYLNPYDTRSQEGRYSQQIESHDNGLTASIR